MKRRSPRVTWLVAVNVLVFAAGVTFGARWIRTSNAHGLSAIGASCRR